MLTREPFHEITLEHCVRRRFAYVVKNWRIPKHQNAERQTVKKTHTEQTNKKRDEDSHAKHMSFYYAFTCCIVVCVRFLSWMLFKCIRYLSLLQTKAGHCDVSNTFRSVGNYFTVFHFYAWVLHVSSAVITIVFQAHNQDNHRF